MPKNAEISTEIRNKLQASYLIVERAEGEENIPGSLIDVAIKNLKEAEGLLFKLKHPINRGGVFTVLLLSSIISFSSVVQAQQSMQQAVQQEQMLRAQLQQGADQTVDNQRRMEAEQQQKSIDDQKANEAALHPYYTPAEQKKNALDWFIANAFMWALLILSLVLLVFILLLHLPNRIFGPDHPVHELPLAIAVRRGMTKARFNENVAGLLFYEVFIITVLIGFCFKSFLAFFIAVFVGIVLMNIKTSAFILIYLFSTFWMILAAQFGYLLCGGQFINTENYVSAWIGGLIVAVLAFSCAFGTHIAGLQYYEDINS